MSFLLDTDHISIIQWETQPEFDCLIARLDALPESEFVASIVSFDEQTSGAHGYVAQARTPAEVVHSYGLFERVRLQFAEFNVVSFDLAAASMFQSLRRRRIRVGTMDLRIASVALTRDLTLLTRNTVDFSRVPGLRFEDWTL